MDYFGTFHPLILHLPIGLLIAAFGLEWVYRKSKHHLIDRSIQLLLGLAALTAVVSAGLGLLLARQGGYEGAGLEIHRWSGIAVAVLSTVFYFLRPRLQSKKYIWSGWIINIMVLTIAGHYGGSLTHGEGYLVEKAPGFIKNLFETAELENTYLNPDSAMVYADLIQPVVEKKCQSCHNETKKQGNLNLANVSGWEKGGKNGTLLNQEKPAESLLLQRIFLPLEHDEHMPPSGKPQLLPDEVALIEWWIAGGMSFEKRLADLNPVARINRILQPKLAKPDPYLAIEAEEASAASIKALQEAGITVLALSQKSPLLEVSLAGHDTIDNHKIDLLKKVKEQIVRMDFRFSGISDQDLKEIASFPNLVHLSLQHTDITDQGLAHFKKHPRLQHLNVYETPITDESIANLLAINSLKELFIWNTKISETGLKKLQQVKPYLELGI